MCTTNLIFADGQVKKANASTRQRRIWKIEGHTKFKQLTASQLSIQALLVSRLTGGMASFMSDGSSNRHPLPNGFPAMREEVEEDVVRGKRAVVYSDTRTKLILKTVFSELCPAYEKYLRQVPVEREVARLRGTSPHDADLVKRVAHLIVEFLTETEQLAATMESFTEQKWNLHGGNIHSAFSKVAQETFRENTNWGRILMFLGFAASFSVYLEQGIVVGAADSVMEWTCQVVEEDLGSFYTSHQGWVSG